MLERGLTFVVDIQGPLQEQERSLADSYRPLRALTRGQLVLFLASGSGRPGRSLSWLKAPMFAGSASYHNPNPSLHRLESPVYHRLQYRQTMKNHVI